MPSTYRRRTFVRKVAPVKTERKPIETPSPQQKVIFDQAASFVSGKARFDSLMISAAAGSGKTSTIVEFLFLVPRCRALFLAFNKAIATELQARVPSWAEAKTLHSLGYGAIAKGRGRRPFVKDNKVFCLACDLLGVEDGRGLSDIEQKRNREKRLWVIFACKVISLAKSCLVMPDDLKNEFDSLVANYDLELPKSIGFDPIETISDIYRQSIELNEIDFDDMIFVPNNENYELGYYDLVLVDEAQDLNAAQIGMLRKFRETNPNVKLVFVGDQNQAIYGFRGAGTDSMEIIKKEFAASEFNLSTSFRCAKAIIAEANRFVPEIKAHDNAPIGEVLNIDNIEDFYSQAANDFVLCRKNAPLISLCLGLLARSKPAVIVGRSVAENLKTLISKLANNNGATPLSELYEAVDSWKSTEQDKARAAKNERKVEEIEDKAACIYALGSELETVAQLLDNIDRIFHEDENGKGFVGTRLMTFHKSKGLENDRVFILPTNEIRCNLDWQQQQEKNLHYVSITRARNTLVFLPNPEADKKPKK